MKFEPSKKTEVAAILYASGCFISSFSVFKERRNVMVSTNGDATDFTALYKFRQLAEASSVRL